MVGFRLPNCSTCVLRWYDPAVGRFLSRDPLLGDILQAQTQNPYVYGVNNPLNYLDPSGQTVRSALDLVRQYRDDIKFIAGRHALEPILLAGVVFAENRNDYNLIKYQDWTAELAAELTGCSFGGRRTEKPCRPILHDRMCQSASRRSPWPLPP